MSQVKTEAKAAWPESPEFIFATTTSFHGIGRIATAPNLPLRVIWTLATVASYVGFLILFASLLSSYFSHTTVTDVTLEFVPKVRFPAVTICNLNKFEDQALTVEEKHYLSFLLYGVQEDMSVIAGAAGSADQPTTPAAGGGNATVASSTVGTTEMPQSTTDKVYSVDSITREKGFKLKDNMHVCTWMGKTCTELNFTHSFSTYGNCYTFNADPANPLDQTIAGSGNGLSVMIDIKAHLYTENPLLPGGTADVGLKLLVHDQNEPPKMDTQGIAVAPGSHAYIAIRKIQYENHIPPWGVCRDLELEYYDTYTLTGCYLECRSKHVVRNCSCRPVYLPGNAPYCQPVDVAHCVLGVEAEVTSGALPCDCPVPCRLVTYRTSTSYAKWPNLKAKIVYTGAFNLDPDYLADNSVVFDVYYEEMSHEIISQLKAMDEGQLASDLGGQMGLFVGASILTLLEIFEYLGLRLFAFLKRRNNRRSAKVHSGNWRPDTLSATQEAREKDIKEKSFITEKN